MKDFSLSPTPSDNKLIVNLENQSIAKASIRIYKTTGLEVKEFNLILTEGENRITIDVSDLSNGVYYLVIDTGDKILSKKFIVSR